MSHVYILLRNTSSCCVCMSFRVLTNVQARNHYLYSRQRLRYSPPPLQPVLYRNHFLQKAKTFISHSFVILEASSSTLWVLYIYTCMYTSTQATTTQSDSKVRELAALKFLRMLTQYDPLQSNLLGTPYIDTKRLVHSSKRASQLVL